MKFKIVSIIAFFTISSTFLVSHVFAEKKISLQEAVEVCVRNNPELNTARSQVQVVELERNIAFSNFLPKLNVEQLYLSTDQQVAAFGTLLNQGRIRQEHFDPAFLNDPDAVTDYVTTVSLQQPLFHGGSIYLGYKSAKEQVNAAEIDVTKAREMILFQTVKAYLNSIFTIEQEKVSREALKTAQKNLEMIKSRFSQGLVIKSDYLQAELHVTRLQEQLFTAETMRGLALANLNALLGETENTYYPSDVLTGGSCPDLSLEELTSLGLRDHPEIQSIIQQTTLAELHLKMSQGRFLPQLNAQGSYDYHGEQLLSDGADSYTVALSLKLNIFNGTADIQRIKQIKAKLETLKKMKFAKETRIMLEIKQAFLNHKTAEQRYHVSAKVIEQAEEGLNIIEKRYQEGATGIVELLKAELATSQAKLNRIMVKHDLLLSQSTMAKSIGHLYTRWLEPEKCPVPQQNFQLSP